MTQQSKDLLKQVKRNLERSKECIAVSKGLQRTCRELLDELGRLQNLRRQSGVSFIRIATMNREGHSVERSFRQRRSPFNES